MNVVLSYSFPQTFICTVPELLMFLCCGFDLALKRLSFIRKYRKIQAFAWLWIHWMQDFYVCTWHGVYRFQQCLRQTLCAGRSWNHSKSLHGLQCESSCHQLLATAHALCTPLHLYTPLHLAIEFWLYSCLQPGWSASQAVPCLRHQSRSSRGRYLCYIVNAIARWRATVAYWQVYTSVFSVYLCKVL